jgi:hypothetical protein
MNELGNEERRKPDRLQGALDAFAERSAAFGRGWRDLPRPFQMLFGAPVIAATAWLYVVLAPPLPHVFRMLIG